MPVGPRRARDAPVRAEPSARSSRVVSEARRLGRRLAGATGGGDAMANEPTGKAADRWQMPPLSAAAGQTLRRAVRCAGDRPVTTDDVLTALRDRQTGPLPPVTATLSRPVRVARALAAVDRATEAPPGLTVREVEESIRTIQATEAGLDLNRLRFARFLVARGYGDAPGQRHCRADASGLPVHTEER